ncbi:MAG: DUF547 domain-containing protein [Candidatus Binatia bacterium]|nr:DUF547 domain-containing protein [Candidatus Binatia bacterium]
MAAMVLTAPPLMADFDHSAWDRLLRRYVHWIDDGHATAVDYSGLQAESHALDGYLNQLSAVDQTTFDGWPKSEQLAFLINAYNAFTFSLAATLRSVARRHAFARRYRTRPHSWI